MSVAQLQKTEKSLVEDLYQAVERACARIAPTWPLDRFIAVNPFWGMVNRPKSQVAADLLAASGSRLLMPRDWYRQAYAEGRLADRHIAAALRESGQDRPVHALLSALAHDPPPLLRRSRVSDVADTGRDLLHGLSWDDFITHNISQFCASYFDEGQAAFAPDRSGGLYAAWLRHAAVDRSPALLMDMPCMRQESRQLPTTPRELLAQALETLDVPGPETETYLWSLLLAQNGWAAWCAYGRWTARLAGGTDDTIVDLLAIRAAWELMLWRSGDAALRARWQLAMAGWPAVDTAAATALDDDWIFQRAMERAYQESVVRDMSAAPIHIDTVPPAVQAVFCIDVRSEPFRRALEAVAPAAQTLGFAGFFGMPVEYVPAGTSAARPQLPGLLAPRLTVRESGGEASVDASRARQLAGATAWKQLSTGAVSGLAFVEAMGPTYAAQLLRDTLSGGAVDESHPGLTAAQYRSLRPRLASSVDGAPVTVAQRCDLAAGVLKGMGLTKQLAPLVLLVGHGSRTRNNPHAAGLDCGACCGQTGEVNARAAAALLNEAPVRAGLRDRGIHIPDGTRFLAALHNTTTDEVTLFETEDLPPSHRAGLADLERWLRQAGARTRAERAQRLGLAGLPEAERDKQIQRRSQDWAQVRPEWGLADNAAFVVAPRERIRHANLRGRSFLHEYRHQDDAGYAVLEQIMTAPMVVTHWINAQYEASTVDNVRYGSGSKVLHNVVGGHIGVFEGNGGDLRIGLALQSVHDGEKWMHTPLRLSVFIAAPREAIDTIIRKHEVVRQLVDNGWLFLFQIEDEAGGVYARERQGWARQGAG